MIRRQESWMSRRISRSRLALACHPHRRGLVRLAATSFPASPSTRGDRPGPQPDRRRASGGRVPEHRRRSRSAASGDIYVGDATHRPGQPVRSDGTFIRAWGWDVIPADAAPAFEICTTACQAGANGAGPGQFASVDGIAQARPAPCSSRNSSITTGSVHRRAACSSRDVGGASTTGAERLRGVQRVGPGARPVSVG